MYNKTYRKLYGQPLIVQAFSRSPLLLNPRTAPRSSQRNAHDCKEQDMLCQERWHNGPKKLCLE